MCCRMRTSMSSTQKIGGGETGAGRKRVSGERPAPPLFVPHVPFAGRVLVCGGVSRRTCIKDKHTSCRQLRIFGSKFASSRA